MTISCHIKALDRAATWLAIAAVVAIVLDVGLDLGLAPWIGPAAFAAYALLVLARSIYARHAIRKAAPIYAAGSKISKATHVRLLAVGLAGPSGVGLDLPTVQRDPYGTRPGAVATSPYLNQPLRELHEVEAG